MGTQVAPLGLRLFMEGIEVPAIASQIAIRPNQPAAASVQIIPTDTALLFLPRTLVHLFFLADELSAADRALADQLEQQQRIDRFEVEDSRYRLLFTGEVVGLQYTKTTQSRSMVLQCLDLSTYWDTCYQWFADFSVGGSGLTDKTHQFVGAGEYLFNNISNGTRWVIGNILASRPENPRYQKTTGLLAGYIHLLETIGGLKPKSGSYDGFRGVNDFFTIAELKYNLTAMVGAVATDTTSVRMYNNKAFRNWLRNGMASAGSLVSFRDVLRLVGQYIFHDVYPNPAAFFIRGGDKAILEIPRTVRDSKLGKDLMQSLQGAEDTLITARTNFESLDSSANAINHADGRDLLEGAQIVLRDALANLDDIESTDKTNVRVDLTLAAVALDKAARKLNQLSPFNASLEDRLGIAQGVAIAKIISGVVATLDNLITAGKPKTTIEFKEVTTSDFLFNQLLLPETFFVPPPRCNVIFPDQYTQFSYSRNFMREVSRLSCQGGLGIIAGSRRGAGVLGTSYFAPNIRDVRNRMARETIYKSGTTILPHETHSGIIPKFEWVTDGHRWGLQAFREAKETKQERKIAYIQRLANFQFFQHRWAARTASVTGRFNPMLVLGFPGVVIDRATPSPAALEAIAFALGSGKAVLPTAYIGKIEQITHDINQQSGMTSAAFSRVRTHRTFDDEFLGVVQRESQTETEVIEFTIDDLIQAERAGGGSGIEEQKRIVQLFISSRLVQGISLAPGRVVTKITEAAPISQVFRTDLNTLGVSDTSFDSYFIKKNSGDQPVGIDFDLVEVPTFFMIEVTITRNVGSFTSPEGAPPPETILKPGWYSSAWARANISSRVYAPLLGTVAITEEEATDEEEFKKLIQRFAVDVGAPGDRPVTVEDSPEGTTVIKIGDKTITTFDLQTGTVEQAIDAITMLYGLSQKRGLPMDQFIRDFTTRPIATLTEILGSSNLRFDDNGDVLTPETMIEGFHSRAFGEYNADVQFSNVTGKGQAGKGALFLLLTDDQRSKLNKAVINKGKQLPDIPKYLDPRGRAWRRVNAYMEELRLSRGLAGS